MKGALRVAKGFAKRCSFTLRAKASRCFKSFDISDAAPLPPSVFCNSNTKALTLSRFGLLRTVVWSLLGVSLCVLCSSREEPRRRNNPRAAASANGAATKATVAILFAFFGTAPIGPRLEVRARRFSRGVTGGEACVRLASLLCPRMSTVSVVTSHASVTSSSIPRSREIKSAAASSPVSVSEKAFCFGAPDDTAVVVPVVFGASRVAFLGEPSVET
mmetsp:Transcript_2921/g.10247  ORF Transcript_2921/g.10247 Transcript_2921/m.10247 type:complete len:217 (-) Transcript_2921:175-825(-)